MRTRIPAAFVALLVLGLAAPVAADETVAATPVDPMLPAADAIPGALPADAPAVAADAPLAPAFGAAVALDRLDGLRGGAVLTILDTDTRGRVDGNTASNVTGAPNTIADGSFGASAGISTVIQNSGSNVLIQNSTVVNVSFVDPSR